MASPGSQRTLRTSAVVSGFGYWSGIDVRVEFRPAPIDTGIVFVRADVGSSARIPALAAHRVTASRRTNLRCGEAQVDMVEHILAALAGLRIDNCEVWVDAQEMPGCDGSALPFAGPLVRSGMVEQEAPARSLRVDRTIRVGDGDCWIEARPIETRALVIEFQLDYPNCPAIGSQRARIEVTPQSFLRELAPCRTFLLAAEAEQLRARGLGDRVTSRDLLVFDENGPQDNPLRFTDECVRHKALDVLGDLTLTGRRLIGEFVANRSGHRYNAELAAQLVRRTESHYDRAAA